ncbi:uncharacterized protein LOC103569155 [Trichonephila clavipes]|nr:uncharacterized protein LOC103569155 [Trichonephila clavipes]
MGKKYLLTIAIPGYRPSIENVELSSPVQHNASPDKNSRTIVMVSFLDVTGIKPCPDLSPNQNALRIASGTLPTLIRKEDKTPLTVVQFLCSLHHCKRWCRWSTFNGSYNAVEFQHDKFWQLEELGETKPFTNEEIAYENHFKRTHTRDSTGRFVVNFPFRDSSDELGSSRDTAVHRLQRIERRFSKNKSLSSQYHEFMNDYLKLGHMALIPENEIDVPASSSFYLPHHPVPNKNGDKFRVVFDGSAKSSSGISLNDKLMVGPQLQTDLTTILLRFRTQKIAITADIEKMYRQITLQDSDFQRIVWRNSPFEPIQDFRLTRIAYGTASAPYLAIKCLQQLALNEANNCPCF